MMSASRNYDFNLTSGSYTIAHNENRVVTKNGEGYVKLASCCSKSTTCCIAFSWGLTPPPSWPMWIVFVDLKGTPPRGGPPTRRRNGQPSWPAVAASRWRMTRNRRQGIRALLRSPTGRRGRQPSWPAVAASRWETTGTRRLERGSRTQSPPRRRRCSTDTQPRPLEIRALPHRTRL